MHSTASHLTMHGRSVVALRAKLGVLPAGAPESWVEMAYESAWKGHPSGEFAFTRDALASIVSLFDASAQPLPVTYGHPDHSSGKPTPAAGWIREMQLRDGTDGAELWGRVEWTSAAAEFIRAGEYRYCSVVVDFAPVDRASGEPAGPAEMYELALTNSPFLPRMAEITLSRVGVPARSQRTHDMALDPKKMVEAVAKALGLKRDATPEEIKGILDAVLQFVAAQSGSKAPAPDATAAAAELSRVCKLADPLPSDPAMPEAEVPEAPETTPGLAKLAELTGLDPAALDAAMLEKAEQIAAVIGGSTTSGLSADTASLARGANDARLVELTARVNALSAEKAQRDAADTEARIVANFARIVGEGRASESERDVFLKCSAESESITLAQYEARPAIVPPTGALVTGSKAPAKGKPVADSADVLTLSLRSAAKGLHLTGTRADEFVARGLANARNTGA